MLSIQSNIVPSLLEQVSKIVMTGAATVQAVRANVDFEMFNRSTWHLLGIEAFANDASPDAYEKVVDRLLASPHYGERWGRYWLDVARYSDDKLNSTMEEPYANSFRYRDWVIRAFNEDMPYDLFVKAQIAGDLLPEKDPEKYEPGLALYADSPEFQDDRVDVTTRGFLGLTVACAQCHDHKFDPIKQREYYQLFAFFNQTVDDGHGKETPSGTLHVPGELESSDDVQKEQCAFADDLPGEREDVLHRLLGQDRPACGDPADQRDVCGLLRGDIHRRSTLHTHVGEQAAHRRAAAGGHQCHAEQSTQSHQN